MLRQAKEMNYLRTKGNAMGTKASEIFASLEALAPLAFQENYDNCGLQVGFASSEVDKVLVCLDVTEAIIEEAARLGCQLVISHHPLIFKGLKQVSDLSYQQRCIVAALRYGISVYSSHTCLDNAPGGVNGRIADMIGLTGTSFLQQAPSGLSGSGLIGELPEETDADLFFHKLQRLFEVQCLRHSQSDGRKIRRVVLCGGAGAFLLPDAVRAGADCFITGELHYHDYFENRGVLLAELGHYQSEQFTCELIRDTLASAFPGLGVTITAINTNPIRYSLL